MDNKDSFERTIEKLDKIKERLDDLEKKFAEMLNELDRKFDFPPTVTGKK